MQVGWRTVIKISFQELLEKGLEKHFSDTNDETLK